MTDNDLAHDLRNERPLDAARERVEDLTKTANAWLSQVPEIQDEETAKRADDFLAQITAELQKLDADEKAEKRPLRDQIAAIGQGYAPLVALLDTAKSLLTPRLGSWLRRKQQAAEAKKRRQQEEADRLIAEAQRAERAALAKPTVENAVATDRAKAEALKAAHTAAQPIERAQVRGNYSGRARSLRVLWRAEITDKLQLYVYYADHPDVIATLQRLANAEAPAAHREGRQIPGCKLTEKEIAA